MPIRPGGKWIFSGLSRRGEHINKGAHFKTSFFLLQMDYNDFPEHFKQNPSLEKS